MDIDWDGIPEDGIVDAGAWMNACRGLHPEFAGGEDAVIEPLRRKEKKKERASVAAVAMAQDDHIPGDEEGQAGGTGVKVWHGARRRNDTDPKA